MKNGMAVVALGAIAALGAWVYGTDHSSEVDRDPGIAVAPSDSDGGALVEEDEYPLFVSTELSQGVWYQPSGTVVTVNTTEYDPANGAFVDSSVQYATSYKVNFVTARIPNELYVFGTKRNGDDVIEKWDLEEIPGAWVASRPPSALPIGTPDPSFPVFSLTLSGGSFIDPGSRIASPVGAREEIYLGSALGGVLYAAVDPDGRFLLVLDAAAQRLVQVPIDGSSAPSVLFDSTSIPEIVEMGCIAPRHEASLGRMYIMTTSRRDDSLGPESAYDARIVFFDYDNDGNLDDFTVQTYAQFVASDYSWSETYTSP